MNIAVYTIAKNESQHLEKWFASCSGADTHVLCDTGSDDNTVEVAKSLGITVVKFTDEFSFDRAKNFALAAVPETTQFCISLDCDETLMEGWREVLESANLSKDAVCTVTIINTEDEDALTVGRIHGRHGFEWKNPIHEYLAHESGKTQSLPEFAIYHSQDKTKSRDYTPRLLEEIKKDPDNWRLMYSLAMDLAIEHNRPEEAVYWFRKVLEYSDQHSIDFVCYIHRLLGEFDPDNARYWLHTACDMAPFIRENWFELSGYYYEKDWEWCLYASRKAINIAKPTKSYIDGLAWGDEPYRRAADSALHLGIKKEAERYQSLAKDFDIMHA